MAQEIQVFHPRMKPNDPERLDGRRTVLLSLSFFSVLLAWSYFNLKVPLLLEDVLPDVPQKDILKGLIMALDNLLAIFLQPFFGNLSDRTRSRFGRRIPYIVLGVGASAVFFVAMPWIKALGAFILVVFLFDLAMSLFRTPALVIMPDYTSAAVRSKASGIQQFTANMGGVIGFAIPIFAARLPVSGPLADASGFILCALVMIAVTVFQLAVIRETPTGNGIFSISRERVDLDSVTFHAREADVREQARESTTSSIAEVFTRDRNMVFFLLAVMFWYLGFAAVEAFFSSFAFQFLGKTTDAETSVLFLAYTVPMILSAYFVGLVGQKFGRKRALYFFLSWMIIALSAFSLIIVPNSYHNANNLVIMSMLALISMPWMGVIVNSFPVLWSLAPEGRVGTYTGIYYTFNQAAYTFSPLLMGAALSLFSGLGDFRYIVMFPYVLVCIILGFICIAGVRGGEVQVSEDERKELENEYGNVD